MNKDDLNDKYTELHKYSKLHNLNEYAKGIAEMFFDLGFSEGRRPINHENDIIKDLWNIRELLDDNSYLYYAEKIDIAIETMLNNNWIHDMDKAPNFTLVTIALKEKLSSTDQRVIRAYRHNEDKVWVAENKDKWPDKCVYAWREISSPPQERLYSE